MTRTESGIEMVVVGASLGGLTAVRKVLSALPADFAPAVAIVQHRRADADSHLPEILAASTVLPFIEVEDKEDVCPGRVYLAPANYHLLVEDKRFFLSIDAPVSFSRPSIDVLFESAADRFGPAVVAVVLTGSSEDGAAGARAIKRAGGVVLVQDPREAESPVLPKATIAATSVDAILALPKLAQRLVSLCGTRSARQAPPIAYSTLNGARGKPDRG
jgi:two-component system chemotaxis response regulator CheB